MASISDHVNEPHHHHHRHMSVMELGHLLTRSGLPYLEVSSEVCHDSFCQLGNSVSLHWAVCREAFCLHVVSSSSCTSFADRRRPLCRPRPCRAVAPLDLFYLFIQFLLYSSSLSRTGVISNSFAMCEFVL